MRPDRAKPLPRELAMLPGVARGARAAAGLSQRGLGERLGLSDSQVRRFEEPDLEHERRYVRTDQMLRAGREYTLHVCRELCAVYQHVLLPEPADIYGENDQTRVIALGRTFGNAHRAGAAFVLEGPAREDQLELFVREGEKVITATSEAVQSVRRRLRAMRARGGAR